MSNYISGPNNISTVKDKTSSLESLNCQAKTIENKKREPDGVTIPYEGGRYIVEAILDYADQGVNKNQYLIKWKGWSSKHNSWEPLKSLVSCEEILLQFYKDRKNEFERIKAESKYVRMSDGKIRRQGPKLAVPPDPRPLTEVIDEFSNLNNKCLTSNKEQVARQQFFASLQNSSTITWEESKIKYYMEKGFNGKLKPGQNLNLQKQLYYLKLKEEYKLVQKDLKKWEYELNTITQNKPKIIVENKSDLCGPPNDFVYSNFYVPGKGVTIPQDPPLGCDCTQNGENCWSNREHCCPSGFDAVNGYTKYKKVKEGVGIPIYECNKACTCGPNCCNRVVQDGHSTLEGSIMKIFRTSNGRGWGVKTMKSIQKGVFVGLYIGEIITTEEADSRGKIYDAEGRTYLFDLDFNTTSNPFTVDAKKYGNFTHFINHSCDANLGVYSVWVNCLDPNLPMLALFSLRDIEQFEEITMNYRNDLDGKPNHSEPDESGSQKCLCGSKKCRGYLF